MKPEDLRTLADFMPTLPVGDGLTAKLFVTNDQLTEWRKAFRLAADTLELETALWEYAQHKVNCPHHLHHVNIDNPQRLPECTCEFDALCEKKRQFVQRGAA